MNIETPQGLAQDLILLNPDVVAAMCGQIVDITPKPRKVAMGKLIMDALFDENLLKRLVEHEALGDAVAELETRQILPMHYSGACSKPNEKQSGNDDDLLFCRAAGQIWKSSPNAYLQTYPTSRLWNDEQDWHIIEYAGILLKSSAVIEKNPHLLDKNEAQEFLRDVENSMADMASLIEAVSHQSCLCPERITPRISSLILEVLGWLHIKDERLCRFDVNSVGTILNNALSNTNVKKVTPAQRRAATGIRRRSLAKIGAKKGEHFNPPKI